MRSFTLMLVTLATSINAQSITLTEGGGRPLTVGEPALYGVEEPTNLTPRQIADSLKQLCTPDPGGADVRAAASVFGLSKTETVLKAMDETPEARIQTWAGPSAVLVTWNGDDTGLKGRPIAIFSRAYTTTGPYGPFRAKGAQCNVVISVRAFSEVPAIATAIGEAFGVQPVKLVVKDTFSDGYWTTPEGLRVNLTAPAVKFSPQPVHLSVQAIPPKGK